MFVELRDGARLAYDSYDFTDPWREPETVVLVHGFSKNRKFWYRWIPALASRYRVICVDQRGHGDSDPPPEDFEMALTPFAADLDDFAARLQLPPAHWVMAEFTSCVAVEFAIRYPGRLRTLVLPGFAFDLQGVDAARWVELVETGGSEAWARETNHLRLGSGADPALKDWYVQQQSRVPASLLAKVFRYIPHVDLSDRLSGISMPTLVIAGGASRTVSLDRIRSGVDLIPDGEIAVLPDAPFNVMNSRPEESAAATLDFLQRRA